MGFQESFGTLMLSVLFVAAWVVAVELVPEDPSCPDRKNQRPHQQMTENAPFDFESLCGFPGEYENAI